jgi:hypothetical protein
LGSKRLKPTVGYSLSFGERDSVFGDNLLARSLAFANQVDFEAVGFDASRRNGLT